MDLPEKLFKDFHFQLLLNKKNNQVLNSHSSLRHLVHLSNVHCSQQNMSERGMEGYKSELFAEYFKLVDGEDSSDLLPLSVDSEKKVSLNRNNYSQKECLNKFGLYLSRLGVHQLSHSKFDSIQSGHRNVSNFFGSSKESKAQAAQFSTGSSLVNKTTGDKINQAKFSGSGFSNRSKKFQSDAGPSSSSSRLPMKNRYEELPETFNKKKCVPPETKSSGLGFVSASTMYRNPLKKSIPPAEEEKPKDQDSEPANEAFKNFDKKIVDIVLNEIMDFSPNVKWTDIAGLEFVKTTVQEIVIWPLLRPDIFTGLRAPPRGILLFGPPGTGKTLIGKCIATESNSTFFCISASSLASKWVGESEQMVRVLFAAARLNQPAVIFIDEIDSLLSQRSDKDQDFTRKLKTEFLVQFDGAKTNSEERVLVVGATNRPHELDEAARRRFVKRLFVPLPDESARKQIIEKLLGTHRHDLSSGDLQQICKETEGYSGSDVAHLCKEAAMGPIRSIGPDQITTVSLDQVRPISLCDFKDALRQVRASVVADDMNYYIEWNKKFGSFGIPA